MSIPIRITFATLVVAAVAALSTGPAFAEPEISESNVANGDVLDSLPESLDLCFSEPVINDDLAPDVPSAWGFTVTDPDMRALGLRIVFDTAGDCVEVFPGLPSGDPEGIWNFDWFVTSQETLEEARGEITFRVGPGHPPAQVDDGDDDSIDFLLIAIIAVGAGALATAATAAFSYVRRSRSG